MGVLSFLGLLTMGGYLMGTDAYSRSSDEEYRREQKSKGRLTYIDHKGKQRYVVNNEICMWTTEGDLKLLKSGRIISCYPAKLKEAQEVWDRLVYWQLSYHMIQVKSFVDIAMRDLPGTIAHGESALEIFFAYEENYEKPKNLFDMNSFSRTDMMYIRARFIHVWNPNLANNKYDISTYGQEKDIYDVEMKKYYQFFQYDLEKVKRNPVIQAVLRDVIDQMVPGKFYWMEMGDEVITFPFGKYAVNAVCVAKKGSLIELPENGFWKIFRQWDSGYEWFGWMNFLSDEIREDISFDNPVGVLEKIADHPYDALKKVAKRNHVEAKDIKLTEGIKKYEKEVDASCGEY